jgi:hypothetical protein
MRRVYALILVLAAIVLWSSGCSDEVVRPKLPQGTSEEAMVMALYLSGELRPPYELTLTVERDLEQIRSGFAAEYPAVDTLFFRPQWLPSRISVRFDEVTAQKVIDGDYQGWDTLNRRLRVTDIELDHPYAGGVTAVLLFQELLNTQRLQKMYERLPGVVHTGFFIGNWNPYPNVFPRITETGMSYLFLDAWGDCVAGCIHLEYWYFVSDGDAPVFVGTWNRYGGSPEPDWWPEAKLNEGQYWGY